MAMTQSKVGRMAYHRWWMFLLGSLFLGIGDAYAESICAVVKIEIRQELTLERQAFEAHLRINNALDTLAIEDLAVDVLFEDEEGNPVLASGDPDSTEADFFIRIRSMDGVEAVDGTGTIAPASSADIRWLIVPAPGAGGSIPSGKLYFVGARVGYSLGGEPMETEVAPDYIYVQPLPLLTLDYFLTADVFADDPFTDPIEPSEPFTLGVRVRNNGQGPAAGVRIESAQPEIVDNEQGLLIDFRITGSSIDDAPATPSLLADLGDIAPGGSTMARWIMETTLAGQFVDFYAELSHADELGGQLTSIIDAANTHFLIRDVLVDLPGRDAVRDFLALDGDIKRVYESSGVDTEATDQSAHAQLHSMPSGRDELSFPETAGFVYVQLPDPYRGTRQIAEAYRSDGKSIRPENVWFSKKRNRDNDTWEYYFDLFDVNSTGRYVLAVEEIVVPPSPPVMQFIPDRRTREGGRLGFIVEASDPNGTVPTIAVSPLPDGASWTDETSSTLAVWAFDWPVAVGQGGDYFLTFTASDGVLETSQIVRISVDSILDSDGDGIADWADPAPDDPAVALPPVWVSEEVARADSNWFGFDAPSGFVHPVVIAGPPSENDGAPGVARIRGVTDTGLELRFQEWDYLDGEHPLEEVPLLVVAEGRHAMSDGSVWEAGTFTLDEAGQWESVVFKDAFAQPPRVLLTVQTENGPAAVAVRADDVTGTGFSAAMLEEQASGDGHPPEVIGYLAVHSVDALGVAETNLGAVDFETATVSAGHDWTSVLGARVRVQEEQSFDEEIAHVLEELHVLALDGDLFAQITSFNESDPAALRQRAAPNDGGRLDLDMNGAVDASNDGQLILRRLFGFSGPALVDGALAADATNTDADAIAAKIDAMEGDLDIDGNGRVDALSDGILIQRRLLGWSGEALIQGALADDATVTDPEEIAESIDRLRDSR